MAEKKKKKKTDAMKKYMKKSKKKVQKLLVFSLCGNAIISRHLPLVSYNTLIGRLLRQFG